MGRLQRPRQAKGSGHVMRFPPSSQGTENLENHHTGGDHVAQSLVWPEERGLEAS